MACSDPMNHVEFVMMKAMSRSEAGRAAANARWAGKGQGTSAGSQDRAKAYSKGIKLYNSGRVKVPAEEQSKFDAMHEQLRGLRGRKTPPTPAEKKNLKAYHRGLQNMLDGRIPQEWPEDSDWMPSVAAVAPKNRDKARTQVAYILTFLRNNLPDF